MTKVKEFFVRLFILLVGLCIAHLGVTLFLLAELGSDPFNVLVQGIFRRIYVFTDWKFLTHGRIHVALCLLIIFVLLLVDKSYIKAGTLACMVFGGPIIDFFTWILSGVLNSSNPMPVRLVSLAAGCVILAYGMTIVIKSDAGTGPNDLVAVVISDKAKWPFALVRVVCDLFFAGAGFLLGGTIGVGTLICAFLVGPVAGFFMPLNESLIQRIMARL